VGFRLYADEDFDASESIRIGAVERDRIAIALRIPPINIDLEALVGVPAEALRLIVTLEDRVFKNSRVVAGIPLSELSATTQILESENSDASSLSWAGETRVHVAIVLSKPRKGEPGTAHRVGSWLARKTFSVGNPRDTASFPIDAVEPEYFVARGLPPRTTYFVEILDADLNQSCDDLPELVKISLAKDVHAAIAQDQESSIAKALIKTIFVDIVTTVLATGYGAIGSAAELREDSIIDVVTKRLVKSTGVSTATLQKFATQAAGSQLRAVVQADVELSRALVSAARRR